MTRSAYCRSHKVFHKNEMEGVQDFTLPS